ncbi:MAG TPA: hypothetical protein VM054_08965 [bacterium]|nr:hypothetical protein [bacterium]
MRKFLLLTFVVAVGLFFTGCGKELNDENFAAFWLDAFKVENEADAQKLADDYGWTDEDMDKYFEELKADEARADKLIASISEKNEDAGFALELTLFPDRAFGSLMEGLGDLGDLGTELEGLGTELEGAMGEVGEALEDVGKEVETETAPATE